MIIKVLDGERPAPSLAPTPPDATAPGTTDLMTMVRQMNESVQSAKRVMKEAEIELVRLQGRDAAMSALLRRCSEALANWERDRKRDVRTATLPARTMMLIAEIEAYTGAES